VLLNQMMRRLSSPVHLVFAFGKNSWYDLVMIFNLLIFCTFEYKHVLCHLHNDVV